MIRSVTECSAPVTQKQIVEDEIQILGEVLSWEREASGLRTQATERLRVLLPKLAKINDEWKSIVIGEPLAVSRHKQAEALAKYLSASQDEAQALCPLEKLHADHPERLAVLAARAAHYKKVDEHALFMGKGLSMGNTAYIVHPYEVPSVLMNEDGAKWTLTPIVQN